MAILRYGFKKYRQFSLTEAGGQYILKPIPMNTLLVSVNDVPENEHLTMQIAEQVFGISTTPNALIYFRDGTPAYITKRFDVMANGEKLLQEDLAQITGRARQTHGEHFKYDGTYEEIGTIIKRMVPAAIPNLERLFYLVLFNYVFSNGDAHLKNFSLIHNGDGDLQLAPAYDLLSTVLHTPNDADTALELYENSYSSSYYSRYGHYGSDDFLAFGKRIGLLEKRVLRFLKKFIDNAPTIGSMIDGSFLSHSSKIIYLKNFRDKVDRMNRLNI
ncbi:MAG TPA: HipA domain-containing protein [Phnomibacter sp.]|nr:HipA domain-containing protein [Phnomibacter sp.]